ncbi:tnc-2 [Symbiodinium pilosum]|uniref:Calmodulin n=1 Tax=Symbiodinium pilosum TaxID=2952 RepID=A0A812V202_SYMPI|nr:tnc-2 [Symbiodinium pilosum]
MFVLKHLRNFHQYDKSGTGTISIPEMKAVLRTTTIGLTERDLKSVLKQVDADGDGAVSFPEYLRLAQKLAEMQNKTKGKSSRIPRLYLEPAALEQYTDLFEGAAGEDGAVSLSQLQEFLQQHKMTISEERLTSIMKEVDDDDSGVLELDEFLILLIKALGIKKRKVGPEQNPASQLRQEGIAGHQDMFDCALAWLCPNCLQQASWRENQTAIASTMLGKGTADEKSLAAKPEAAVSAQVIDMFVSDSWQVVLDGRHFERFRAGNRGTVLDVDRESGCCRVAFDESPGVLS